MAVAPRLRAISVVGWELCQDCDSGHELPMTSQTDPLKLSGLTIQPNMMVLHGDKPLQALQKGFGYGRSGLTKLSSYRTKTLLPPKQDFWKYIVFNWLEFKLTHRCKQTCKTFLSVEMMHWHLESPTQTKIYGLWCIALISKCLSRYFLHRLLFKLDVWKTPDLSGWDIYRNITQGKAK